MLRPILGNAPQTGSQFPEEDRPHKHKFGLAIKRLFDTGFITSPIRLPDQRERGVMGEGAYASEHIRLAKTIVSCCWVRM